MLINEWWAGNDSWSGMQATKGEVMANGTVPGPLRTLAAAVTRARSLYGPNVRKTVQVAAGTYVLSATVLLNAQDNLTSFVAEVCALSLPTRLGDSLSREAITVRSELKLYVRGSRTPRQARR
jgi:hypothetical protein